MYYKLSRFFSEVFCLAYSFSWFHSRLLSLYKDVVPIVFAFIRRPSRFSIDLFICVSLSSWVCIISIDGIFSGWKHIEHCTREKWYRHKDTHLYCKWYDWKWYRVLKIKMRMMSIVCCVVCVVPNSLWHWNNCFPV